MKRTVSPHERLVAAKAALIYKDNKKALGLTMERLGQQLGITQSAVSQYLNAGIPMGAETIIRLSDILKVDVAAIDPDFNTRFHCSCALQHTRNNLRSSSRLRPLHLSD